MVMHGLRRLPLELVGIKDKLSFLEDYYRQKFLRIYSATKNKLKVIVNSKYGN
jgi:hypothetical protein